MVSLKVIAGGATGSAGVEYHPPQEAIGTRGGEGAPPAESLGARAHAGDGRLARHPGQDAGAYRVVGCRVDWLSVAFRVALDSQLVEDVTREAEQWGRVAVTLGGIPFEAKKMRSGKRLLFKNADVGIVVDPEGPDGWSVQVDCPGEFMSRSTLERATQLAEHIAGSLGSAVGARVRRLDLAADIAGLDMRDIDLDGWVKPSRAKVERAHAEDLTKEWHAPELRQYHRGGKLTGYTICPGNPLCAVVYDKLEELRMMRPDKLVAETERWKRNGWDGKSCVTRVEFRLRSESLHQLGARDGVSAIQSKLDAIWAYCSRMWLRLVLPWTNSRLARCHLHPAWEVVRSVVFRHGSTPAMRVRMRGGVTAAHALGAIFSLIGSEQRMPIPLRREMDAGVMLDRAALALDSVPEDALETVKRRVSSMFGRAARVVARTLVEQLGPREAMAMLLEREDATRARFSGMGSISLGPPGGWCGQKYRAA